VLNVLLLSASLLRFDVRTWLRGRAFTGKSGNILFTSLSRFFEFCGPPCLPPAVLLLYPPPWRNDESPEISNGSRLDQFSFIFGILLFFFFPLRDIRLQVNSKFAIEIIKQMANISTLRPDENSDDTLYNFI
jgi:hypothetical protein